MASKAGVMRPPRDPIGLRHALRGFMTAVRHERNLRLHLIAAVAALLMTWWLQTPLLPIVLAIALVIALELVNTAVEAAVDLVEEQENPLARRAKDTSAAAVVVAAVAALAVAIITWGPALLGRLTMNAP